MERRNTKQRQIVLDAVKGRCDHPTVEQIYKDVHEVDSSISLGTVYRNLAILSEEGQILDIKLSDADRFDLRTDKHNHFICEKCGKVFDIEMSYDDGVDNKTTTDGFYISKHQTMYSGLCPECVKLSKNTGK